jgi:hypothetical protein
MTSPPAPAAPGRQLKQAGLVVMVLGVLFAGLAAIPVVAAFRTAVQGLNSPIHTAPFTDSVSLRQGKYLLLESVTSIRVVPDAVQVIDSAGNQVTGVRQSSGDNWIDRGGTRFVDVVEFSTSHSGRYLIMVADPPDAQLIVGRDPVDVLAGVAGWFGIGAAGVLLVLVGFVLLLVGISRKPGPVPVYYGQSQYGQSQYGWPPHQPSRPGYGQPPVPPLPPPGWYPDPGRPAAWRYWDGYRWQP